MKLWLVVVAAALSATGTTAGKPVAFAAHPEARPFDEVVNAEVQIGSALAAAKAGNKMVLVMMGGNWCHDSRALAGWFVTPRFAKMLNARYTVAYVDIGMPQIGEGKNLNIPKRYGIKKIKGTPTVMILSADGKLLNRKDAAKWRNASTRHEDAIYRQLAEFTAP